MPQDANGNILKVGDPVLIKLSNDLLQGAVSAIEHPGKSISTPSGPTQPAPGRVTVFAEITFFWNEKMDICQTMFKLAPPDEKGKVPERH